MQIEFRKGFKKNKYNFLYKYIIDSYFCRTMLIYIRGVVFKKMRNIPKIYFLLILLNKQ